MNNDIFNFPFLLPIEVYTNDVSDFNIEKLKQKSDSNLDLIYIGKKNCYKMLFSLYLFWSKKRDFAFLCQCLSIQIIHELVQIQIIINFCNAYQVFLKTFCKICTYLSNKLGFNGNIMIHFFI